MATTSPIDVERYLLQGEGEPGLDVRDYLDPTRTRKPGAPASKLTLDQELTQHYNSTLPPGAKPLAPGELPPPVVAPVAPAEPGILDRAKQLVPSISMPSFSGGNAASQLKPITPVTQVPPGTPEIAPEALQAKTDTLNKSRSWLHSFGEAAFTVASDVATGAFGFATAASDILNAQLARIAKGGPLAGGPESSTHYRDIFKRMDETVSQMQYQPQTGAGQAARKITGGVTKAVGALADLAVAPFVSAGILNEDTAAVLGRAAELYLFYKLDAGVRKAAPELRSKIAGFKERMSKARSDADVAGVADDLATAASRNPQLEAALDGARKQLRDAGDAEAGRPPRPPDEGPTPGGAAVDPADLRSYSDSLRVRTEELRTQRPDLFGPEADVGALKAELDKVPKPQARGQGPVTTQEMIDARLGGQQAAPQAQQAPQPQAAPTMERPVQPEVVVGQETAVAPRATRPPLADLRIHPEYIQQNIRNHVEMSERWGITDDVIRLASEGNVAADITSAVRAKVPASISDADLRSTVRAVRTAFAIPNMDEVRAGEGVLPPQAPAPRAPITETAPIPSATVTPRTTGVTIPPEVGPTPAAITEALPPQRAAATVAPETVPAPVSPEAPAVAAVTPTTQNLRSTLTNATRNPRIGGAVIISADPIAQDILKSKDFSNLEYTLGKPEIRGILGAGTSSIVLEMADGRALRLGLGKDLPWPGIPEVIRPEASGEQGRLRWQIMPRLETNNITEYDVLSMTEALKAKGYLFNDPGTDNLGRTPDGKIVVIDPGAVTKMPTEYRDYSLEDIEALAKNPTKQNLSVLKSLVSKVSEGKGLDAGLERLGFTEMETEQLKKELRKVRAARKKTGFLAELADQPAVTFRASPGKERLRPAVQTAASEAVLDTAPAGTEVEIPAPNEPLIDSTPVVEKPKRKRRVVKAQEEVLPTPEQWRRELAGDEEVMAESAQRAAFAGQQEYLVQKFRDAGYDPAVELRAMRDAYDKGVRPLEIRQSLGERGLSDDLARSIADIAFNLHVRGESLTESGAKGPGKEGFTEMPTVTSLSEITQRSTITPSSAEPVRSPIQVRTVGGMPDALFIDTSGMSSRTTLAEIEQQVRSGRTSAEVGQALRANLQRQADISGLRIGRAHEFTGQELIREATRIAAENDLDLYVKKGKNYELVPKDVVRTDARLNAGDDLRPIPISRDAAGAYAESKTSPIGPDTIREIQDAIERGVDISDKLPAELLPHYRQMRESERAGIDTSERRAFIDILNDLNTMLGEQGTIGGQWTRDMRMAAQRLQADMRKLGKNAREFLFGARPEDVAMFERYLDTINNPAPPDSTNPRNMRFDPENIIPGDRVVKHRTVSVAQQLQAVPLWQSEVTGIQNARDIKPGGTVWDLKLPLRQHKQAGTEFLYYAYRTAQKNLNAELNVLHADMQELARGFSSKSLENIGANGYARQGGDGQRILTYNKVTPQPMSTAERRLQATIDGIYAETFNRLQEARAATGREPLSRVDDYQTFARTISLLNHLGIKVDLARATRAEVDAAYLKHKATNFPYVVRKHAFYTAEMNALKILDTYMQSALKDIHLSPFLAKMHELIETKLPDPVTGQETWSLKEQKEGLYNELRTWTDYLSTGTNLRIPDKIRIPLNTLNKNIAYSTLSGLIRSAGIQLSTIVNTQQALGPINTFNAVMANLADHIPGPSFGKRKQFALDNSEILSSRKFIDAYNEAAGAIIGRRPRDFFHAIRTGAYGDIQQAVGRPGFKLMELFDMEAAVMAWNGAYKQARSRAMNYNHKDAVRYADDLVVRTQGSTMPGDLAGMQRNAAGKLITQFQTFLISDWNFLTNEVLSKGKVGGGGGGQIPPGGVVSGSGSWETGGPRSSFQMVKNILQLLIATQIVNELYKLLHIQPAQPDPVKDIQQGMAKDHNVAQLAWDIAVGQVERVPIVGAMRYGKGMFGPFAEISREAVRSYRGDPLAPHPLEPTATLSGVPFTRQISKTARALKRGESTYDSLMGWYSEERSSGGRPSRGTRSERRSR